MQSHLQPQSKTETVDTIIELANKKDLWKGAGNQLGNFTNKLAGFKSKPVVHCYIPICIGFENGKGMSSGELSALIKEINEKGYSYTLVLVPHGNLEALAQYKKDNEEFLAGLDQNCIIDESAWLEDPNWQTAYSDYEAFRNSGTSNATKHCDILENEVLAHMDRHPGLSQDMVREERIKSFAAVLSWCAKKTETNRMNVMFYLESLGGIYDIMANAHNMGVVGVDKEGNNLYRYRSQSLIRLKPSFVLKEVIKEKELALEQQVSLEATQAKETVVPNVVSAAPTVSTTTTSQTPAIPTKETVVPDVVSAPIVSITTTSQTPAIPTKETVVLDVVSAPTVSTTTTSQTSAIPIVAPARNVSIETGQAPMIVDSNYVSPDPDPDADHFEVISLQGYVVSVFGAMMELGMTEDQMGKVAGNMFWGIMSPRPEHAYPHQEPQAFGKPHQDPHAFGKPAGFSNFSSAIFYHPSPMQPQPQRVAAGARYGGAKGN